MGLSAPPVSTLADVFPRIQRLFSLVGDGTSIFVGKEHLDNLGPGAAPRVVFVPDESGELGPVERVGVGHVAAWRHGCGVVVLGVDSGDDASAFAAAYAIADRVVASLRALDPVHLRIAGARPKDESALKAGGPGRSVRFSFVYDRPIAEDKAITKAAKELVPVSPSDPARPLGDTGLVVDFALTTEPTESRA